jgi:hypothetical protein
MIEKQHEGFAFTPVQMQRAHQLEMLSARIYKVRDAQTDIGAVPIWQNFTTTEGKFDSYKVTPQVLWGMMRCRRALFEDVGSPSTALAIVEKYLTLNDQL